MGSTNQSELQALVSKESRERCRGQGRGYHRGTKKGRWRLQARDSTVRCFYCDQEGHIKRDCPKYKAHDQSSETTATTVMAVDEDEIDVLLAVSKDGKSNWVLDSGSAYHLCRDREVFSTYATCERCIWMANNTASRVVSKGSIRFCMADGRSVTLTEGKKTRGLYRLERSVQTRGVTVRHGSSGIIEKIGQGKQSLHRVEVIREERWSTSTRKVTYFAAHPGGGGGARSYGGAGSEVVRMDNLKTSDYPLVGWNGRLLSLAHLDESKPSS
ncbi:hypothetical protein Acr_00g0084320 [Actinidia rufa]|uniref:CCHC-type domain-containing protein n=1 Tax=Actinidia rufa TaxID=165716 RepID=A0A7J0DXQ0_9ERIC|nr:hypothetical protein Acr_00g0084320 [Actinidia rufa]